MAENKDEWFAAFVGEVERGSRQRVTDPVALPVRSHRERRELRDATSVDVRIAVHDVADDGLTVHGDEAQLRDVDIERPDLANELGFVPLLERSGDDLVDLVEVVRFLCPDEHDGPTI